MDITKTPMIYRTASVSGTATAPENGTDFKLKELQDIVGGYIGLVPLETSHWMVVNEEGLLLELPVNPTASAIAGTLIVGDVLVCLRHMVR